MGCGACSIFRLYNFFGVAVARYVPTHLLNEPHVVVDGSATPSTVLTLSHWPGSASPEAFRADLSASMAFKALHELEAGRFELPSEVITNNHYDEDGLVSVFALVHPQEALAMEAMLLDIASAGDFGVFRDRDAARVSFVLNAWACPALSPLNNNVFKKGSDFVTSVLYEELLFRLPKLISKIDHFHSYWQEEDTFLSDTEQAFGQGLLSFSEDPHRDLMIVRVDEGFQGRRNPELSSSWVSKVLHPFFVHNKSNLMRILVIKGSRRELYFRYETWVQYQSRVLCPRLDLSDLAIRLNLSEKSGRWRFNGTNEIIARLYLDEDLNRSGSSIPEDLFLRELFEALDFDQS